MRFNPRARGGRDMVKPSTVSPAEVSIHAPAGGATTFAHAYRARIHCFNPRARGGRD